MNQKQKIRIGMIAAGLVLIVAIVAVVIVTVGRGTSTYDSHMELAQQYLDDLQYEQAIAEYEAAIEIDPKNEEAYLALAELYVQMENYEGALFVLSQGIERTDDYAEEIQEKYMAVQALEKPLTEKVEKIKMYQLYYDKLLEVQRERGESTIYFLDEYTFYLTGLCFARLLDFDADGKEELILVYSQEVEDSYVSRYHIEVWNYNNYGINRVFDGEGFGTDGGVTTFYITQVENGYYLIEGGRDSFEYNYVWGFQDNEFIQVKDLISEEMGNFLIDGVEVTEKEYKAEHDKWWENATTYDLWYVDNDALTMQELEKTLITLKTYLGIL